MKKTNVFLVLVLLAVLPAAAERIEVDESRPAAPDGEVSLEILAGEVEFVGWDRKEVRITGTIDDEFEELDVDSDEESVSIEVEIMEGEHGGFYRGANLKIHVPAGSEIEIEAISADIRIEDVTGPVEIEAISGEVRCRGGMREIDIECISGSISVQTSAALESASIETVSGDVEFRGALSGRARVSVESVNGDVTLRLPSNTSAEFEVETFNGSIKNDLGPAARKASKYLPAQELSFSMGSGQARVSIEAFNGTVRLLED